jgi:class 3 adenylate cyclase
VDRLRVWLTRLGLEEYLPAFASNHVDLDVLPELCEDDLQQLGITSLGHRKRLLRAIAELRDNGADVPDPSVSSAINANVPDNRPQRRQLTVLFCDLVGSTRLASKLDPEELRELMGRYRAASTDVVARYGGHVAQLLGDGLLAYFGWPAAHEDDAERALRAALEIIPAVAAVSERSKLQARIGVATGAVVVGD